MRRLQNSLLKENLLTIYHSLIVPYLKYCNIIWATGSNQSKLLQLLKVQKKCLRIITHSHYLAPSAPIFYDLSLLNIFEINKLEIGTFMYKFKNNLLPQPFMNLFQYNSQIHKHNTRSANKFHLWSIKSQFEDKSITHAGPRTWNSIPNEITELPFLSTFRRHYKQSLVQLK